MSDRWDVMSPRTNKASGKTFWHRVGTAFQGQKGINVIFDSLPLPDAEGRVAVSLFEPRDAAAPRAAPKRTESAAADLDDEIPF
jgi:hypothetical protein